MALPLAWVSLLRSFHRQLWGPYQGFCPDIPCCCGFKCWLEGCPVLIATAITYRGQVWKVYKWVLLTYSFVHE